MSRYCQVVMGPAGSGKSTYCDIIRQHCENIGRSVHIVNLDPAADHFNYPCSIDISELITVYDVMEELDYGPNGGLLYCIEYLTNNLDWLQDKISEYEEDYLIIDCPGQIELYSYSSVMRKIIHFLHYNMNYKVVCLYLLDINFINETSKFISGSLMSLSTMINFELPHINILTKVDLLGNKVDNEFMEKFYDANVDLLISDLHENTPSRFYDLNRAVGRLLEDFNLIRFVPLNIDDEDSINDLMLQIDIITQYGEAEDTRFTDVAENYKFNTESFFDDLNNEYNFTTSE